MTQELITGAGSRRLAAAALARRGARRCFAVASDRADGGWLERSLRGAGLDFVRFSGFSANPRYEDIVAATRLFRESGCDSVMAVGGGSAIDTAKCVKLFCRMDTSQNYLEQPYEDTGAPLAAVPTTAGSGSEATSFAVIYAGGEKRSVAHDSLLPDIAALDPQTLATLPLYQKKCTLLDALCHAVEAWWSVNSTEESVEYSRRALSGITSHMDDYFEGEPGAAEAVMFAANAAGRAINIAKTTAAHAMCYKLTSSFALPHGHAVALCLPRAWRYILEHPERTTDIRGAAHLAEALRGIALCIGARSAEEGPARFEALLDELCIAAPSGADRDVSRLAAFVDPARLKNFPVSIGEKELAELYRQMTVRGK